ncbi:MAG: ATP-binding protein, partial [Clostridiales bacterium]|nr:ATP-binding protein [Clostridiales bacterium]
MKITANSLRSMKMRFAVSFVFFVAALFLVIAITSMRQLKQAASITASIAGMPVLQKAAAVIDGDRHERLAHSLDPTDPFYREAQEKLRALKAETQCLYLYTMAPYRKGVHRFILDAEDPDSEFFSPLGSEETLDDYDRAYLLTYETKSPQCTRLMYQSKWGRLISAYMPIVNSQGEVVGVIGIDFDGAEVYAAIQSGIWQQCAFAVIFVTIGLFFYFLLLRDLTRQNEALLQMSQRSEATSQAKSDFLARMSHEIRTPMNAITGMAELALREDMPAAAYEHILTIKQAGANLLSIINDILDFSKIETGRLEIVPGKYLFASLVNDVVSIIRMRVIDAQVRFVVNIDCDIPNELVGDEIRIRQVLLNLLSNAVKYTEKGFVSFTVFGEIRDESTVNLVIEVTDSGKGIRPEDIEKLFGAFVQIDLAGNRGIEGTGLGLAITRSIIKAMDGEIAVHSEYGKGSTFAVTLPQKFLSRAKLASVDKPEEKSVLVYEQREIFANSIVCTADNLGVTCVLALNDDEFYEKMASEAFSFVFVSPDLLERAKSILARLG